MAVLQCASASSKSKVNFVTDIKSHRTHPHMNFEIRLSAKSCFADRTWSQTTGWTLRHFVIDLSTHIEMASFRCAASCARSSCSLTTTPYRKLCTPAVCCLASVSTLFASQFLRPASDGWLAGAFDSWFPVWCAPRESASCRCVAARKPLKLERISPSRHSHSGDYPCRR